MSVDQAFFGYPLRTPWFHRGSRLHDPRGEPSKDSPWELLAVHPRSLRGGNTVNLQKLVST